MNSKFPCDVSSFSPVEHSLSFTIEMGNALSYAVLVTIGVHDPIVLIRPTATDEGLWVGFSTDDLEVPDDVFRALAATQNPELGAPLAVAGCKRLRDRLPDPFVAFDPGAAGLRLFHIPSGMGQA